MRVADLKLLPWGLAAVEAGLAPDGLTRRAIRGLCRQRLRDLAIAPPDREFWNSLEQGPIAPLPERANEQHYELPPEFFALLLGPRRKYSCCYFASDRSTLAEAEDAALALTCQRAGLANGQDVLELGCGWGSLSLWMAERYPQSRITAVSNSHAQRRTIEQEASRLGFVNLRVVTADMNDFEASPGGYDRVVSVEMFEHMRNYERLLERIASWLRPDGELFVHLFCHRDACYPFETEGAANWMGRCFFTGGMMPSYHLLRSFDGALRVVDQRSWSGTHYQRTADAWLARLDANKHRALGLLSQAYGAAHARRWLHRWRTFLLAVSETFGYDGGRQWHVGHYRLQLASRG